MRRRGWGKMLAAACALVLAAGCNDTMWLEYRDDPYLAGKNEKSNADVMRGVNDASAAKRQIALRSLAARAGEARLAGRRDEAQELETVIIRRYGIEKDQVVRASIVRMCAPAVGRGSTAMVMFLRDRIAAGEFPGYAALSLAYLGPRGAFDDIEPLTRHPAPEVRLQAAEALTILGDQRGYEAVSRVWRGMQDGLWPERVEGVSRLEAKTGLEQRARRVFGRPLA